MTGPESGLFTYDYSVHCHSYVGGAESNPTLDSWSLPFFDPQATSFSGPFSKPTGWSATFVSNPTSSQWSYDPNNDSNSGSYIVDPNRFIAPPFVLLFEASSGNEIKLNDPALSGFGFSSLFPGTNAPSHVHFQQWRVCD